MSGRTTLNQLFGALRQALAGNGIHYRREAAHRDFRAGDVRHSQADIGKAQRLLGYVPTHGIESGIAQAMPWNIRFLHAPSAGKTLDKSRFVRLVGKWI